MRWKSQATTHRAPLFCTVKHDFQLPHAFYTHNTTHRIANCIANCIAQLHRSIQLSDVVGDAVGDAMRGVVGVKGVGQLKVVFYGVK